MTNTPTYFPTPTLSLRDQFAIHAPPAPVGWQGTCSDMVGRTLSEREAMARWAYAYADAMVDARGIALDETSGA
jgi:hypothetical protein